jgi:endonuclease III
MGAHGMLFRRRRVFVKLREAFTYEEIAAEEGVGSSPIRQLVSGELKQRAVDSGTERAKPQLERLAPAIQLAALTHQGGSRLASKESEINRYGYATCRAKRIVSHGEMKSSFGHIFELVEARPGPVHASVDRPSRRAFGAP